MSNNKLENEINQIGGRAFLNTQYDELNIVSIYVTKSKLICKSNGLDDYCCCCYYY